MREHQITVPTDPRVAEGYSSARALGRTVLAVVFGAVVGLVVFAATARATGSDSPTPYTVDQAGITLPAGQTFPAHAHINVRWDGGAAGLHFDPNNGHPGAAWIGQASIPWSAVGVPADACVTWVQISSFNEHYGEGGQAPVCLTEEDPWPTPTPTTPSTPTVPPAGPSPEPTVDPTPSPSATTGPSPAPSLTTPSGTPASTDPTPTSPAPQPSATATGAPSAATTTDGFTSKVSAVTEDHGELAQTGTSAWLWVLIATGLIVLGAYLIAVERRERCPKCGADVEPTQGFHHSVGDWDGVACTACPWVEAR